MSDMVRWVGIAKKTLAPRDHGPSITCPQCSMTSHKPNDVELRYCGNCQELHDLMDINDDEDGVITVSNR